MRNALNALQSTVSGFGMVTSDSVFKVCDQPHPVLITDILDNVVKGESRKALEGIQSLYVDNVR